MFWLSRILCVLPSVLQIFTNLASATKERPRSTFLNGPLKNLRIFDEKLYIGGTDRIYVLNKDLSANQSASTCGGLKMNCGNINQILLINEKTKELLVCGTGNGGICDVRSLGNIELVIRNSSGVHAPLKVSSDANRPAQALMTKAGSVTAAVTFGKGIAEKQTWRDDYLSYEFAISTRNFIDFEPMSTHIGTKTLNVEIEKTKFHDYVIYYKAGFQLNWYTYFVTNQKNYVGGSKYVSKLARLCQNDTDFNSYTDIVVQCVHNGSVYNLIQDAIVLEPQISPTYTSSGGILVGVFRRGVDPSSPTGDSVVCMSVLEDFDDEILLVKKKHALTCGRQDPTRRYLPNLKSTSTCINETDLRFRDYDFSCENAYPTFLYVIGNTSFSMTSSYKVDAKDGFVTSVHGSVTSDGSIVIIVGTSAGNIFQMTQPSLGSPLEVFNEVNVNHPVRRVHIENDDTIYAMSDRKVFLFNRSNCSEFTTCDDAMNSRNPLCGWCVYKQRVTRKAECSDTVNHWISSFRDCRRKMSVSPSSIPVNISRNTNVTVNVAPKNLPKPFTGDAYQCRLLNGSVVIATVQPRKNGSAFTCILPRIQDHTEATIQFTVQTASLDTIVLSMAPILFFQCANFKRCGECISRSKHYCEWCTQETRCQSVGSPCTAELKASTKPRAYVYTCKVPSAAYPSTAANSGDSIFCSINISRPLDVSKQAYRVKVSYSAEGQQTSELEDDYGNFVTVYNCSMLANDCSHCQALNKSMYNCGWCANKKLCGYNDENCTVTMCPAPTITKIIPRDGPCIGHTKISVFGSNLGSDISDIERVEVADVLCELSKDVNEFLMTKSEDFETSVPTRIVCLTGPFVNETAGFVNVTVNGKVSISPLQFSYRIPVVSEISPQYGPRAGGTLITIYGENLGIGNRNTSVLLGNKRCLKPLVKPELPLEFAFSGNFSIVCTVDEGYNSNITTLSLSIDGVNVVTKEQISFIFVTDPLLHTITPKKAFLSGGTKISIEGRSLNNAHDAIISLTYEEELEVGKCEIRSPSFVICKVPRAPHGLNDELLETNGTSECPGCIKVTAVLHLDNVRGEVEIDYYTDPVIDYLPGEDNVVTFKSSSQRLTITGIQLNRVATMFDVTITVGTEPCVLAELKPSYITCVAPRSRPKPGIPGAELPEVNVTIGNIRKTVGYVQYIDDINSTVVIVSSAVTAVVLILCISLGTLLLCRKYRKTERKFRSLVKQCSISEGQGMVRYNRETENCSGRAQNPENTALYTDINNPGMPEIYSTVNTNDIGGFDMPSARQRTGQFDMPPSVNRNPSLRVQNNVTVKVLVEGAEGKELVLQPRAISNAEYLHPIHCQVQEEFKSDDEISLDFLTN